MTTAKLTIKEGGKEREIFIPGADQMDRHELQDIVQWQEEKTRAELRKSSTPQRKHSKKDVGKALKDYNEFLQRRRKGEGKLFGGFTFGG